MYGFVFWRQMILFPSDFSGFVELGQGGYFVRMVCVGNAPPETESWWMLVAWALQKLDSTTLRLDSCILSSALGWRPLPFCLDSCSRGT